MRLRTDDVGMGIIKVARQVGVGTGTVRRIKAEMTGPFGDASEAALRRHHSRRSTADRCSDRFEHLWRPRPHDRGRADRWRAGRFPQRQGLRAARLTAVELTG
jgi:hypothetical protein